MFFKIAHEDFFFYKVNKFQVHYSFNCLIILKGYYLPHERIRLPHERIRAVAGKPQLECKTSDLI